MRKDTVMPTLVIGYSVEWTKDRTVTSQFLTQAREVHERAEAPSTLYLVGGVRAGRRRSSGSYTGGIGPTPTSST